MISQNGSLELRYCKIGRWTVPTLDLGNTTTLSLCLNVHGLIVNSITERKDRLQGWKVLVASEVKVARGGNPWSPHDQYAIAVGFSFNGQNHGYQALDVENFIKPVVDALAAGLFCDQATDLNRVGRWDYDDSNFNTLLIHRLEDARRPEDEGIAISISSSSLRG